MASFFKPSLSFKPTLRKSIWSLTVLAVVVVSAYLGYWGYRQSTCVQAIGKIELKYKIRGQIYPLSIAYHRPTVPRDDDFVVNGIGFRAMASPWYREQLMGHDWCVFHVDRPISLYMGNTRTADADLANLGGLPTLEYLELHNTDVTDSGLAYVGSLRQLKTLNLTGTEVTDAGIARLQRGLPGANIIH